MIQIVEFQAHTDPENFAFIESVLAAKAARLTRQHPALKGSTLTYDDGVATLILRVFGRDRWAISSAARLIATAMLRPIAARNVTLVKAETAPNGRSLTKETGRNPNHTPRPSRRRRAEQDGAVQS